MLKLRKMESLFTSLQTIALCKKISKLSKISQKYPWLKGTVDAIPSDISDSQRYPLTLYLDNNEAVFMSLKVVNYKV